MTFWGERDSEHAEIIREVWLNRFNDMFCEEYALAGELVDSGYTLLFDVKDGLYGYCTPGMIIHPNITKQHLSYLSKKVRSYLSRKEYRTAVWVLTMTNLCIELIEMGVPKSIVELYYNDKMFGTSEKYDSLWFADYKELEEEERFDG
ncbi:MAG: hypothetical protein ACRCX2_29325 [Paraclostridium sp.]